MTVNWFCAARRALDVDLAPVVNYLKTQSIPCWVSEEQGRQCIWLQDEAHLEQLHLALQAADAGQLFQPENPAALGSKAAVNLRLPPITLALLLLSGLGALLVVFDPQGRWISWLTFTDVAIRGNALYFSDLPSVLERGQWWRLVSPMFLHFGLFHVLFNSLWIWELGRRIELRRSGVMLLGISLFTSVSANVLQYFMAGPSLFGGMSGVLYGFVGYIIVWQRLWPARGFGVSPGILGFMLVWLVLCFTGAVDFFIDGQVANGAHLGGLLGGLLIGFVDMLRVKLFEHKQRD